jgi:hypothetical protein
MAEFPLLLAKMYQKQYHPGRVEPVLSVRFFKTETGTEPVRDWLLDLSPRDRKTIGTDIKTVQFGWPLGMPLVRKMELGLARSRRKDLRGAK